MSGVALRAFLGLTSVLQAFTLLPLLEISPQHLLLTFLSRSSPVRGGDGRGPYTILPPGQEAACRKTTPRCRKNALFIPVTSSYSSLEQIG